MQRKTLERYRQNLLNLAERVSGEVEHVTEAIRQDANPAGNLSTMPVHPADAATQNMEADVRVLEAERSISRDIQTALDRIESGTYGKCVNCGETIEAERLDAIPYTGVCVKCSRAAN
jgi:DnaK suppressor protein